MRMDAHTETPIPAPTGGPLPSLAWSAKSVFEARISRRRLARRVGGLPASIAQLEDAQ